MERDLMVFLAIALVACMGLVSVMDSGATGAAIEVVRVREYRSFAERLCPNPNRPVPVIVQTADEAGTTGKDQLVTCVSADTKIEGYGRTFYPEWNRKNQRFSYGYDKFHKL